MKVIKNNGRYEEFDKDKVYRSIKSAAYDCNYTMNNSDIKVLTSSLEKEVEKLTLENRTISSKELKMILYRVLNENKFNRLAEGYIKY